MKMRNFIIKVVILLIQLSSVSAGDDLNFNSSYLNISLPVPLQSSIKSRISLESDFKFLFIRIAPVIYQLYFIFTNDPNDEVKKFSRYYNDSVQMILPPLLLLVPSLISPYEIYDAYTIRNLHFASIVYYFSSSASYHWVTGIILFSVATSLQFAHSDTRKYNQECSFIFKLDCVSNNEKQVKNNTNNEETARRVKDEER
ncbi:27100_t:CDS:2 [Dentiscutata erythropus]|uniref:27100_t:CDS:1 n=1 Tax=Dentiscutata erythropus TaxID=1348616 RepID=A0A9N9DR09_9GLOM|nr:27100_t:CDS:2 [Dentiscutata erythropus]